MNSTTLRRAIAGLLLVGAALFTIGAIVERDRGESTHTDAVNENQADHETATEAARQASNESAERSESSNESAASSESSGEGTVLGVDVESTRTIAAAIVGSLALATSIPVVRRRLVFGIVGGFAFAFAALDVAEVVHQVGREAAGLATLAALVAAAHLAAGVLAAVPLLPAHRRDT